MASCNIVLLFGLMFCFMELGAPYKWWGRKHRGRACLFGPEPDEECQYSAVPKYSECDDETQTYTKSYLLENGPEGCDLGYVTVQRCIHSEEHYAPCHYVNDRSERWSYCDRLTFTKTRKMVLESGGSHCPDYSYKTKPCRKHHRSYFNDYDMVHG